MYRGASLIWYRLLVSVKHTLRKVKKMKKYTVKFKIETYEEWESVETLEAQLKDVIASTIAPSFNFTITPLTFEVKKARN